MATNKIEWAKKNVIVIDLVEIKKKRNRNILLTSSAQCLPYMYSIFNKRLQNYKHKSDEDSINTTTNWVK